MIARLFRPPDVYATSEHPLDVAVADVNADGHLDVLTASREGRSVSVFVGRGDGTLDSAPGIDTALGATSLALADMNADGNIDVVVSACTAGCTENSILIFFGSGDGRFGPASIVAVDGVPYNVAVADFDLDGLPDIAASDYPGRRLLILLSARSPGSYTEVSLPTGEKPIALVVGDLNGDGVPDLISSDHGSASSSVYLAYGDGEFSERIEVATGPLPYSIALGSIDGDAIPDLIAAHSTDPGRITILQGRGDGTFSWHDELEVRDRLIYVDTADFNADGLDDIVVTRENENTAGVFLNEGDGLFSPDEIPVAARNRVFSLAVAELNADRWPDFVTVDYEQNTLSVSLGLEPR
jgi:hypothetical protein